MNVNMPTVKGLRLIASPTLRLICFKILFFSGLLSPIFSSYASSPQWRSPASEIESLLSSPRADQDGIERVKTWAVQNTRRGEKAFATVGLKRQASPPNWLNEVIYQIQVDRFNDGDFSNNKLNIEKLQVEHQLTDQYGLPDYRHGGDLQGIIDRLDYLKELGITTLWITPIFKSSGSYHGYCTSDFTQVDPAFGSNALFRQLVSEAHQRGLKIVLDIVVNHMCDSKTVYNDQQTPFKVENYGACVNSHESKDWTGNQNIYGQRNLNFSDQFFGAFRNQNFFTRCGFKAGDSFTGGAAAIWGDFSNGMFDFDTNNWDFQDIFTEIHKYWIAYADVDGFRMDAAKHVTADFVAKFSTDIRNYAKALGKENFFVIGEVAGSADEQALRLGKMTGSRPHALNERLKNINGAFQNHGYQSFPGLTAVYDFSHSGQAAEVLAGWGSPMTIKNWFWQGGELENSNGNSEFLKIANSGDSRANWNMIEIHDWPRFLVRAGNGNKLFNALGYLLTTSGTPVLYYGVEQGFNGTCPSDQKITLSSGARDNVKDICGRTDFSGEAHPKYRQDMFTTGPWRLGSRESTVDRLAGIGDGFVANQGNKDWRKDPYLQTNHSLFRYVQNLIEIRQSCKVLREGNIYFRAAHGPSGHNGGGFMAFSRITPDQDDEVLVLVNNSNSDIPISQILISGEIQTNFLGQRFVNLLNRSESGQISRQDQKIFLNLNSGFKIIANGIAIFVRENQVRVSNKSGHLLCTH